MMTKEQRRNLVAYLERECPKAFNDDEVDEGGQGYDDDESETVFTDEDGIKTNAFGTPVPLFHALDRSTTSETIAGPITCRVHGTFAKPRHGECGSGHRSRRSTVIRILGSGNKHRRRSRILEGC
jgi:hypothetical protein